MKQRLLGIGFYLYAAFCIWLLLASGCANVRQDAHAEIIHPNGDRETKDVRSRLSTIGSAKNALEKVRVTNGKTLGIGIGSAGQESSDSNIINAVTAGFDTLKAFAPK